MSLLQDADVHALAAAAAKHREDKGDVRGVCANEREKNKKQKNKKNKKKKKKKKSKQGRAIDTKEPTVMKPSQSAARLPERKRKRLQSNSLASNYPFQTEYGDHFETSDIAFRDIVPVLTAISDILGKPAGNLEVYDPYYCKGSVKRHLKKLGFPCVYNKCEDFYLKLKRNAVPKHDVLLTNPPYSGDHKVRLLNFLALGPKPWLLLLPGYCSVKHYFTHTVGSIRPFFIVPAGSRYEFTHPEGTGHPTSPFQSFWFVCGGDAATTQRLYEKCFMSFGSGIIFRDVKDLIKNGIVSAERRPNPRQRRKRRKKMK